MQEEFLKKLIESLNEPYPPTIENLLEYMKVESHENFLLKVYGDKFYDVSDDDMCDLYLMIKTKSIDVQARMTNERRALLNNINDAVSSFNSYFKIIEDVVKKEGDLLVLLYCWFTRNNAFFLL